MTEVGIRALEQNAPAVVAEAAGGETVTITDRGHPVAQLTAIVSSRLTQLRTRVMPDRPGVVSPTCQHPAADLICPPRSTPCETQSGTDAVAHYLDTWALDLGDDLESIVTYDHRLAGTARANGVTVTSPA